jgi:hypothetical protein
MPTRKSTLAEIRYLLDLQRHAEERLATLSPDVFRDETLYEKNRGKLQQRIDSNRRDLEEALESYALFPQRHYDRHSQGLNARFSSGAFESNVFIMTRFPAAGKAGAERLNEVIDRVEAICRAWRPMPFTTPGSGTTLSSTCSAASTASPFWKTSASRS